MTSTVTSKSFHIILTTSLQLSSERLSDFLNVISVNVKSWNLNSDFFFLVILFTYWAALGLRVRVRASQVALVIKNPPANVET